MNIEKRADGWYAVLSVPSDLKQDIGRAKLLKKLASKTEGRASQEASPFIASWKKLFKKIRDSRVDEAQISPQQKLLEEALQHGQNLIATEKDPAGREATEAFLDNRVLHIFGGQENKESEQFLEVAYGINTPLEPLYNEWAKSKLSTFSLKTADSYRRDAKTFVDKFPNLESVTKRSMKAWINELMEHGANPKKPKPMTYTTLRDRFICGVRHFWNYLDAKGLVDEEKTNPMVGILPKEDKTKINLINKGWIPFATQEVVEIYNNIPLDDIQMPTVVAIGMFTGLRIEEVCSLTVDQIIEEDGIRCFDIKDSKTLAGIRTVPIHSQLIPLVDRLIMDAKGYPKVASKDAYLIPDLGINKYGNRANAVGKRFGRLKTALGFPRKKVYHSIRKCVVTQLDRAGFRETSIADVVGHDNPNMTMGRYSAGSDAVTKQKMVEAINYPSLALK
jgi:integrase